MNAHIGPDEVGADLGLSCLHHLIRPHHVLLECSVFLQDRELGWGPWQCKHWMFLWRKSRYKPDKGKSDRMHREPCYYPHGKKDGIAPCPRDPVERPL